MNKKEDELIIEASVSETEITLEEQAPEEARPSEDDLPSAEDADRSPVTTINTTDPEPFDPYDAIDAAESADVAALTMLHEEPSLHDESTETPTEASVAADIKAAVEMQDIAKETADDSDSYVAPKQEPKSEPELSQETHAQPKHTKHHFILASVIAILTLAAAVAAMVVPQLIAQGDKSNQQQPAASDATVDPYSIITGSWKSSATNGSCYVFLENKEFYWLMDCTDTSDNYYYGTFTATNSGEALKELNINLKQALGYFNLDSARYGQSAVNAIHLHPTKLISAGEDITHTLISDEIKMLFIGTEASQARAYQYGTGDSYKLTKVDNIVLPTQE